MAATINAPLLRSADIGTPLDGMVSMFLSPNVHPLEVIFGFV